MKRTSILFLLLVTIIFFSCKRTSSESVAGGQNEPSSETSTFSLDISHISEGTEFSMDNESSFAPSEETSDERQNVYLQIQVMIYNEESQALITSFELEEPDYCARVFETFNECFAELCEKYPRDAAPDKDVKTDYRVVLYLNTYYDADKEDLAYYIDISYPFGYTNDIYRLMHHGGSPFGDYVARCGKPFIDMVDQYVKQYIPAE